MDEVTKNMVTAQLKSAKSPNAVVASGIATDTEVKAFMKAAED